MPIRPERSTPHIRFRFVAGFLDIPIDETRWDTILDYCSFDWMKQNATKSVALGGAFWDAGAQVFINKGVNGRWTETLTREDVAQYEAHALQELGPECARWLATGTSQKAIEVMPRPRHLVQEDRHAADAREAARGYTLRLLWRLAKFEELYSIASPDPVPLVCRNIGVDLVDK